MIRKESKDGIGYSVIELNGISHVLAAAVPRTGNTLREQAKDALQTIEGVIADEGTRGAIVKQSVFLRDADQLEECQQIIRDFYGEEMPATTYILQPPCCDKLVSIEALGVGRGKEDYQIERVNEQMVITRHSGVSWIHCGQIVPQTDAHGIFDRSLNAFEQMNQMLHDQGVKMQQIVRTWLYLGDIVGPEGDTQRYKELNRARTKFFDGTPFGDGMVAGKPRGPIFPASTGIGTANHNVVMDCIAIDAKPGQVQIIPLENPAQTAAFDYGTHYSPKSPKFSRAMALANGPRTTIFVSGTASITDSETRWVDDVERQTHQTLDNIAELISEDNLAQHDWSGRGATLDNLAIARVYIKNREDYEKTRAVCEARLGELPTVYAIADVCRDDLLVEIEGIAFS